MEPFRFQPGPAPLLISMPHVGTYLPDALAQRMTDPARAVPDTDWHVDRLYDFAASLGANLLIATHSRYVIDLNRPPDGTVLYPGASNTELCPTTSFDDEPLWQPGEAPGTDEVRQRIEKYWRPYHGQLAQALAGIKSRLGTALLFDAHSIRSEVPRFFAARLPDINLGNYVKRQTGRENMKIWQGTCIVHATFPARRVVAARSEHPDALIVAHPECPQAVLDMADFIGSTSALIDW